MRDPRLDTAIQIAVVADESISVRLLAEAADLSQPRFSHLFSREIGILPGEHLLLTKEFRRERQIAVEILGNALHDPKSGRDRNAVSLS
jgi:hypothetical protein